jgi:hypothetical protein
MAMKLKILGGFDKTKIRKFTKMMSPPNVKTNNMIHEFE